jgi:hypothetical protein
MPLKSKASYYRIYLLTIWEERGRGKQDSATWRFCLKDPQSGQQRGFANLTALVTALLEEIAQANEGQEKGENVSKD